MRDASRRASAGGFSVVAMTATTLYAADDDVNGGMLCARQYMGSKRPSADAASASASASAASSAAPAAAPAAAPPPARPKQPNQYTKARDAAAAAAAREAEREAARRAARGAARKGVAEAEEEPGLTTHSTQRCYSRTACVLGRGGAWPDCCRGCRPEGGAAARAVNGV